MALVKQISLGLLVLGGILASYQFGRWTFKVDKKALFADTGIVCSEKLKANDDLIVEEAKRIFGEHITQEQATIFVEALLFECLRDEFTK